MRTGWWWRDTRSFTRVCGRRATPTASPRASRRASLECRGIRTQSTKQVASAVGKGAVVTLMIRDYLKAA